MSLLFSEIFMSLPFYATILKSELLMPSCFFFKNPMPKNTPLPFADHFMQVAPFSKTEPVLFNFEVKHTDTFHPNRSP